MAGADGRHYQPARVCVCAFFSLSFPSLPFVPIDVLALGRARYHTIPVDAQRSVSRRLRTRVVAVSSLSKQPPRSVSNGCRPYTFEPHPPPPRNSFATFSAAGWFLICLFVCCTVSSLACPLKSPAHTVSIRHGRSTGEGSYTVGEPAGCKKKAIGDELATGVQRIEQKSKSRNKAPFSPAFHLHLALLLTLSTRLQNLPCHVWCLRNEICSLQVAY